MVRNKFISCLNKFNEEEIESGINEMCMKHDGIFY